MTHCISFIYLVIIWGIYQLEVEPVLSCRILLAKGDKDNVVVLRGWDIFIFDVIFDVTGHKNIKG
jgi:hypothetical protein